MNTKALAPFGIEVTDFDLSGASVSDIDDLATIISANRVAVFRDLTINDDQFTAFLARFGTLTFTAGEIPVEGALKLNIVSNVGRSKPPRSVFHTDTSYVEQPPSFTALRAVAVPAQGGCTEFSDQVRAAQRLSPRIKRVLEGRTVCHSLGGNITGDNVAWHPILRKHPHTGETALFLSTPERCIALSDATHAQSTRAIAALYRHSLREPGYRHTWRSGDVVVWDNRVTMHRADHLGVEGDRVLHRGMIIGERPLAA